MEKTEEEKVQVPLGTDDQCDCNSEFAVICAFISKFGHHIDLSLDIEELKASIEDRETLDESLIDIHVKLLKKLRRYFVRDQWEKALIRYAYEYSHADGFELDTMGYLKARPSIKLRLLRRLLDAQFECDPKFKAAVNLIDANELRTKPAGRDTRGNTYWPCTDEHGNLRVYREEPLQHKSWMAICKNVYDLNQLIEHLDVTKEVKVKGEPQPEAYDPYPEIFPEFFVKEDTGEDTIEIAPKKTTKKGSKKGRKKSRSNKKSVALETVIEDEDTTEQVTEATTSNQSQLHSQESQEYRPRSASPNESIESHVKYTLENILSKVVSSFDYIFRRKSPDVNVKSESEKKFDNPSKRSGKRKKANTEELPRRSSSRIQQLQQKKVEEEAIKKQKPEIKIESISNTESREPSSLHLNEKSSKRDKKDKQRWRNNKGKKKLSWDKDDSDLSSISSLSESNDESFMEALNEPVNNDNIDDEFACEDEVTNDEPVIIKRARTARQTLEPEDSNGLNNSSVIDEDRPCGRCDKSNDPDWILLCDMCDDGYHTTCCVPPLMYVPDGDWFCPLCEQKMLLQRLKEIHGSIVGLLEARERERQKKQRLRQIAPKKDIDKVQTDEIVPDKRRRDILNELNEPLAVQALDQDSASSQGEELPSSYRESYSKVSKKKKKTKSKVKRRTKQQRYETDDDESDFEIDRHHRRKHPRNISDSEFEEESDVYAEDDIADQFSEVSSEDGEQLKTRKARAFVSYKYEEYDELIQSAIRGESDSETTSRLERVKPEVCNVSRGKDMATIEALAYQQENGLTTADLGPVKQPKQRRRGRKLNDLDAESEIDIATSDESFQASSGTEDIEDEDEATEISSEDDSSIDEIVCMRKSKTNNRRNRKSNKRRRFSDDSEDSDFKPRTRRVATQKVSYRESSDTEDEILVSGSVNPEPMTPGPINELTQYCSQDSYPSNPLFSSFKMSPPHPQFYREDEVRSPTNEN